MRTSAGYRRLAVFTGVTDYLCVLAAFLLAYLIRFDTNPDAMSFVAVMAVAPPLFLVVFAGYRLYSAYRFAHAEEFRRVVFAVATGITGVVIWSYWTKASLSRVWVGLSWLFATLFVLLGRRVWHHVVWKRRQAGRLLYRTLIVGNNDEAAHLAGVMLAVPAGFAPVGYVVTGGDGAADMDGLAAHGGLGDLDAAIEQTDAECLFVASSAIRGRDMGTVTKVARERGLEVRISANVPEMLSTRISAQPLGGVMAFSVWPVRLTGAQAATKRGFDLLVGLVTMVLLSPVWLVAGVAVALSSRGPVLFRQERVGLRGRTFTMLKFRTMVAGADAEVPEEVNEAEGPLFKARRDPRITGVGRVLRRWSMDELPQLLNVLRGDMSLVGPRPSLPAEVGRYEDWQRDRLEVRPGMTGLWQVSGRSALSFDDYVRLDLFYIENWSLAYDLFLLAKTVPAVLMGKGAW